MFVARKPKSLRRIDTPVLLFVALVVWVGLLCPSCSSKGGSTTEQMQPADQGALNGDTSRVFKEKGRILAEGVKNAKLTLETKDGNDVLNVVVLDKAKDSDSLKYEYEWAKNGEPAGTGTSVSGFKRGDKMSVRITPVDGETFGKPKTLTTEIKNSTPKIVELKSIAADEKHLSYQVVAKDADGDPLAYSLVDGAKGMTIDPKSGMLQWSVDPATPQADITVTVKVGDGQGGEVTYPLKVQQQEKSAK